MSASEPDDDLVLNETLETYLTFQLDRTDGTQERQTIRLTASSHLGRFLTDIALAEEGGAIDASLDTDVIQDLQTRQILITREQRAEITALQECDLTEQDVVIATYPKSGTTWMQMIVFQLVSQGTPDVDQIGKFCPYLPNRAILKRMQPRLAFAKPSHGLFFRTHSLPQVLPKRCKYIWILRNPKDVLVSYYHHLVSTREYNGTLEEFVSTFLAGKVPYGSWFDYMEACWSVQSRPNSLVLSYEAMSENLAKCVRSVAEFCGIPIVPQRFLPILEFCSFEFMKDHADRLDPRPPTAQNAREFFRKGKVGTGEMELNREQDALIDSKLRALILKLDPNLSAPNMPSWWHL